LKQGEFLIFNFERTTQIGNMRLKLFAIERTLLIVKRRIIQFSFTVLLALANEGGQYE
jgi:hypothetical protein